MADTLQNVTTYRKVDELMCVCRPAVRTAQAESCERGVAIVYVLDGHLYYELPGGEYTRNRPPSIQRDVRNGALQQSG